MTLHKMTRIHTRPSAVEAVSAGPRTFLSSSLLLLLMTGQVAGATPAGGEKAPAAVQQAAVKGRVFGESEPITAASVFAYEVVSRALERVRTDRYGHFLFGALPAGMYQIVAYKEGFAPAVESLLRRSPDLNQFVEIRMQDDEIGDVREAEDYWAVRSRIPGDVLRQISSLEAHSDDELASSSYVQDAVFAGEMWAHGGVEQLGGDLGEARLAAAQIELQGAIGELRIGVTGIYQQLVSQSSDAHAPAGEVSAVAVEIENPKQDSKLSLAAANSELGGLATSAIDPVGMERYQLDWSGKVGAQGRSGIRADYTEEINFHQPGWITLADIPEASRLLNIEGFYTGSVSRHTTLEAGLSYRQLEGSAPSFDGLAPGLSPGYDSFADQAIDLYAVAGSLIQPRVLVEYGLYSTVRDGSLSLMPHGGIVVPLAGDWKARTTVAHRLTDERQEDVFAGFRSAFYTDSGSCQKAGEACYEITFSHDSGQGDETSLGVVHREFAETLRMYFSPDFFNRLESLFFVDGDSVPELKFRMVRHLTPRILAKLESNFAAGGGGIFYATDQLPYQNRVRYLVASLDTRFQSTSTGVFIAFHHLEQALSPLNQPAAAAPGIEVQRLQLMLTQDLNLLADVAKNWAIRFNVELSRGSTPYSLTEDDELRKKLTGGISVSF